MMIDDDVRDQYLKALIYIRLIQLNYRVYTKFSFDITLCVNDLVGHIT